MKLLALQIPDAQGNPVNIQGAGGIPVGGTDTLSSIISTGINLLILAAVILCLFFLIWGGINWMMSEGDKQKVNQAREKLVSSIIGLAIVFMAYLIINGFYTFFFGDKFPYSR